MTLGYEIECACHQSAFLDAMRGRYPFVGRAGFVPNLGERLGTGFRTTDDRSIRAKNGDRLEVRSPVFPDTASAVRGFAALADVLAAVGAKVLPRCGIHLHVGLPDLGDYFTAVAIARHDWLPVQDAFYDLAYPKGWRFGAVPRLAFAGPWENEDLDAMARLGPDHTRNNGYRFRSLNLYALREHGTLKAAWSRLANPDPPA